MTDDPEDPSQLLDQMSLQDTQALVWQKEALKNREIMQQEYDECMANVNFDKLLQYVRELRPGVECRLLPTETMGGNNLVRAISFDDGERWVARIQFVAAGCEISRARRRSDFHTNILLSEHGLQVPKIYGYDITDEKIGRSFVLMEYLPGYTYIDLMAFPEKQRDKHFPKLIDVELSDYPDAFLRGVATFHARMSSIRLPMVGAPYRNEQGILKVGPWFGRGPFTSAKAYLQDWVQYCEFGTPKEYLIEDMLSSTTKEEAEAYWDVIESFPSKTLNAIAQNFKSTPDEMFPLAHADLNLNNIIVDDELNFMGVVDWDAAQTVPWEVVGLPYFLDFKREGLNEVLWQPERRADVEHWLVNEAKYIGFVEEAEQKYGLDDRLSSCLKDKRCKYLHSCLVGYPEGQEYHYDYIERLFFEDKDAA